MTEPVHTQAFSRTLYIKLVGAYNYICRPQIRQGRTHVGQTGTQRSRSERARAHTHTALQSLMNVTKLTRGHTLNLV